MSVDKIKAAIRDVPDFPKEGIVFKDITPILSDPELFKMTLDLFVARLENRNISKIAAIDARGFLFAGAICDRMDIGLIPIRKQGKLPYKTFEESYDLEYGSNTLAIHQDAFVQNDKVVIVDDLLATGGTAAATVRLVEKAGGEVVEIDFVVELSFLNGREKLSGHEVYAPIVF